MVSIFAFNSAGEDDSSDDEMELSKPNKFEGQDLGLHVERCAARYALLYKRLGRLRRQFGRMENVLWLILIIEAVTNPAAMKIWSHFLGWPG